MYHILKLWLISRLEYVLNKTEFQYALKNSLSGAYRYIEENGDSLVQDALLQACLKNQAFDSQLENRADWLLSIVDLTENKHFYYSHIITELNLSHDKRDIAQLGYFCFKLAEHGMIDARHALYNQFEKTGLCQEYIYKLDAFESLIYFARVLGEHILNKKPTPEDDSVFVQACDEFGEKVVMNTLLKEYDDNLFVKVYVDRKIVPHVPA